MPERSIARPPELPIHPDPHVMTWTASELRAIRDYGLAAYRAGLEDAAKLAVAEEKKARGMGAWGLVEKMHRLADSIRSLMHNDKEPK